MVGEFADLQGKMREEFVHQLSHYKNLKLRFDVNLVLVSEMDQEFAELIQCCLDPYSLQIFSEHDPIGINEKIHDFIEGASVKLAKPIWRISADAAQSLERIYVRRGENYLKRVVFRAVQASKNKRIDQKDIDFARHFVNSLETQLSFR